MLFSEVDMLGEQPIVLRPAVSHDVFDLLSLWQAKQSVRLSRTSSNMPKSERHNLVGQIEQWLNDESYAIYVGLRGVQLAGYIIGCVQAVPSGLMLKQMGIVVDLTIDTHTYTGGLGRSLFGVLRNWFAAKNAQQVMIPLTGGSAVEEAFWLSIGADYHRDTFWIDL